MFLYNFMLINELNMVIYSVGELSQSYYLTSNR